MLMYQQYMSHMYNHKPNIQHYLDRNIHNYKDMSNHLKFCVMYYHKLYNNEDLYLNKLDKYKNKNNM